MFTPPIRAIFVYLIAFNSTKKRKPEIITCCLIPVYPGKLISQQALTLTLFVARVFTNNPDYAFAQDDLAVAAYLFY